MSGASRRGADREPVDDTSLGRGLRVLLSVVDRRSVRADELASELDLPLSTVYRYLQTLRRLGLVAQHDGSYVLGDRLRPPGASLPHDVLVHVARPTLAALANDTRETTVLSVRVGDQAVCLDQVESPHAIRIAFRIGQLLPLHAAAGSKVLLAYAPSKLVDDLLSHSLTRFTPATPTARELRPQLDRIRLDGLATSRGEVIPDAVAIAVPVFHRENLACSLAVAGPSSRCNPRWLRGTRAVLVRAGVALGQTLDQVD